MAFLSLLFIQASVAASASASPGGLLGQPLGAVALSLAGGGVHAAAECEPSDWPPSVLSVTPASGPAEGKNTVRIKGTRFEWEEGCAITDGVKRVLFGSRAGTQVESAGSGEVTAVVPSGTGTVGVTVETNVKQTAPAVPYTYEEPPTVTAVEPSSGPESGGTTVTVNGTHLTGATVVKFVEESCSCGQGFNAKSFKVESESEIVAVSPPDIGTTCITVTTPSGTSAASGGCEFTFVPPRPTVTKLEPNSGPSVGATKVKVTGTGFVKGATKVSFGKGAEELEVESATSGTVFSPAHAVGATNVIVTTHGGASAPSAANEFTYLPSGPVFSYNNRLAGLTHIPVIMSGALTIANPVFGDVQCETVLYGEVWNQVVGSETRGVAEEDGLSTSGCTDPELLEPLEPGDRQVFVTAEAPLEEEKIEAEVCPSGGPPSKCAEKQATTLISHVRRGVSSLPWKAELIRGEREGAPAVLQRTGLHVFGEAAAANNSQTETGTCYPKEGSAPAEGASVPAGCIRLTVVFPQIPAEYVLYGSQEVDWINGSKNGLFPSEPLFSESGGLSSSGGQAGEDSTIEGGWHLLGVENPQLITAK